MMRKIYISIIIILSALSLKSQILNLSFHPEIECNVWCWAITCRHIICYYGNDNITNCEIAEFARSRNPTYFGTTNCCQNLNAGCCQSNYISGVGGMEEILNNWGLNTNYTYNFLTINEISTEITNNRPFVIRFPGHVVVGYGINGNDVYIRDPGWGFDIRDYNILISGTGNNDNWSETIRITNSPILCDNNINLSGIVSNSGLYKSSGDYNLNCNINNNSHVVIKAPNNVNLTSGFSLELGSSMEIITGNGINIFCP